MKVIRIKFRGISKKQISEFIKFHGYKFSWFNLEEPCPSAMSRACITNGITHGSLTHEVKSLGSIYTFKKPWRGHFTSDLHLKRIDSHKRKVPHSLYSSEF